MQQTLSQQMMAAEDGIPGLSDHGSFQRIPGVEIIPDDTPAGTASHEEIAALAYQLWNNRGCPLGSPEEDWCRAERWLRTKGALKSDPSPSE